MPDCRLTLALKNGLLELVKDPNASTLLKYFDFISWAESQVEGVPFSEVVRGKLQRAAK